MDPDISPLGPRERRRRRRGRGRGRSTELEDTQELPVVGGGRAVGAGAEAGSGAHGIGTSGIGTSGIGTSGGAVSGGGVPGIGVPGGGVSGGGMPRSRASGGRAHRVRVYGTKAYRAGRRAAAARNSADAADATAAAAGAAYDALYRRCAADVTRHTYLLTGDHALTREAVEHAFHIAWERWPEVASDRDPPGWVRAAAFEYVQAPWEWLRARRRRRRGPGPGRRWRAGRDGESYGDGPEGEAADRRLFAALLALPESYRSAVVVYDVVGLDLPEAAAELEATTLAAAGRLTHAHEALAAALPELGQLPPRERAEALRTRLRRFAAAQPIRTLPPGAARHRSERRTDRQLRRYALLAAAVFLAAAAVTALGEDYTRDKATPPRPATQTVWPPAPGHGMPPAPGYASAAVPGYAPPPGTGTTRPGHPPAARRVDAR